MDIVKIGGKSYDVIVREIEETFTVLYSSNTGRTLSQGAKMVLDPLGTFFSHRVVFGRRKGKESEYDSLYDFISTPKFDGVPVKIVHGQDTITYDAYISNGGRKLKKIDPLTGKVYWEEFAVNIIPMEAQVLPE